MDILLWSFVFYVLDHYLIIDTMNSFSTQMTIYFDTILSMRNSFCAFQHRNMARCHHVPSIVDDVSDIMIVISIDKSSMKHNVIEGRAHVRRYAAPR